MGTLLGPKEEQNLDVGWREKRERGHARGSGHRKRWMLA